MPEIHPKRIAGRWREGYALDLHTTASIYLGDDPYGKPVFDTTRSPMGELLYRMKYRSDKSVVDDIVQAAAEFIRGWNPPIDIIVPVPPSRVRPAQPVWSVAKRLSQVLTLPLRDQAITKRKISAEIKNIYEYDKRVQLLTGAYSIDEAAVRDLSILLFDDLYRSGATLNVLAGDLYDKGGASDVYALTITRTRRAS